MKRVLGWCFRGIAFLLMSAAYAVPTAVLAFFFAIKSGHADPETSNLIMSLLLCIIMMFVATRVPIRKHRTLWSCIVGLLFYAALSYFVLFGFARGTVSILTPLGGSVPNDVLTYIGAGVFLFAVLLNAQGRSMTRGAKKTADAPRAPEIKASEPAPVAPQPQTAPTPPAVAPETQPIPIVQVQPVMPQSVMQVGQIPVVPFSVQPVMSQPVMPQPVASEPARTEPKQEAYRPVEYVKDEWGNLIARHNLPDGDPRKK